MKKIILFFSVFLVNCLLDASIEKSKCPLPQNQIDLIILNDPYGYELSTISEFELVDEFIKSFFSQVALILVQTSIWQRFLQELDGKEVYAGLKKQVDNISFELYALDTAFVLIVPASYKNQLAVDNKDLPLNLHKLKKIEKPLAYKPLSSSKGKISMVADVASLFFTEGFEGTPITKALEILMIPSSEKNTYAWNLFLIRGHGENFCFPKATFIAGLRQETFRKVLRFCDTTIKTNAFIYSTCYGASKISLIDTYKTQGKPDRYNFPIIIAAMGDALTFVSSDYLTSLAENFDTYKNDPESFIQRWQRCFKELHEVAICPKNAEKIVELLDNIYEFREFNPIVQKHFMRDYLNELIQARWAFSTVFEPLPLAHYIAVASKRIAAATSPFGPQISEQALVLDRAYLDQPLVLKAYSIVLKGYSPKIVSSTHSPAHYIASIRAHEKYWAKNSRDPFDFLIKAFGGIKEELQQKIILIDRYDYGQEPGIEALEKVIIMLNGPSFIHPSKKVDREMFYIKSDGKAYVLTLPDKISTETPLNEQQKAKYLRLFEDTKARLAQEYVGTTPGLFGSFAEVMGKEKEEETSKKPKIIQRSFKSQELTPLD